MNEKPTAIIDQAFQRLCALTVSGPGVEAVAAVMGLRRQAYAAAQALEAENAELKKADQSEEDDGR